MSDGNLAMADSQMNDVDPIDLIISRLKSNISEIENMGDRMDDWSRGRLSAFRGVLSQLENSV